jgi:hypothetical protein
MSEKKNPSVFLDLSIDGDPVERIVIEVTKCHRLLFFASTCLSLLELEAFAISNEIRL